MSNVNASLTPQFTGNQVPVSTFLGSGSLSLTSNLSVVLRNGLIADLMDLLAVKTYTFTGTTPQTADLTALVDVLGAAVNFARIRLLILKLYGTTTDGVTLALGNGLTNPWVSLVTGTGTIIMHAPSAGNPAGAFHIYSAPNTTAYIVGSGNKALLMTPSATCTLDVIACGAST